MVVLSENICLPGWLFVLFGSLHSYCYKVLSLIQNPQEDRIVVGVSVVAHLAYVLNYRFAVQQIGNLHKWAKKQQDFGQPEQFFVRVIKISIDCQQ